MPWVKPGEQGVTQSGAAGNPVQSGWPGPGSNM